MSKLLLSWRVAALPLLATLCVVAIAGAQENAEQKDSIQQAQELMDQVDSFYKEGKYAAAIPLAERAVAIREKALGLEHPDTASLLNNLGLLYASTSDYVQSEQMFQPALQIREKSLSSQHPMLAESLNNLADL